MNKTRFAVLFAAITMLVAIAPPTNAQEEGQWRLDTVVPVGKYPKPPKDALPGSDVKEWWWLPITNVNALIQQWSDEYDAISTAPQQPVPGLWAFPAIRNGVPIEPLETDTTGNAVGHPILDPASSGMALIETDNYLAVIGTGTTSEVLALKTWITNTIGKPVRYVIIPDVNMSGLWYDWWTPGNPMTVFQSSALLDVLLARQTVAASTFNPLSSTAERRAYVTGALMPSDTDWRLNGVTLRPFSLCPPGVLLPPGVNCVTIEGDEETLTLDGLDFRFVNVVDDIGGLLTYIPAMKTLIPPGLFDGHLPNTAPLEWPVISMQKVIAAVDRMQDLDVTCYFPLRGVPLCDSVSGASTVAAYLNATEQVLFTIQNQTVAGLRDRVSLDDIVAGVTIPAWVQAQCDAIDFQPNSPCGEFENSVASMVKGIYTEYMGWFDGTARSLSAHLTAAEKASVLLEVADLDELLKAAKELTAAGDDLASIERALYLVEPLHDLAPSPDVDLLYFQLLWKAGMLQTANDVRNYYLSLAWQHRPY